MDDAKAVVSETTAVIEKAAGRSDASDSAAPSTIALSNRVRTRRIAATSTRWIALVLLGLICPLAMLAQAFIATDRLGRSLEGRTTLSGFHSALPQAVTKFDRPDAYRYASLLFLEASNQEVVLHKQQTKIAVMNIGFAVMCLGLSCILFGFDGGGIAGEAEVASKKFKIQTASSGVAMFLLGSMLAAGGGLLANEYQTAGAPGYSDFAPAPGPATVRDLTVACEGKADVIEVMACKTDVFNRAAAAYAAYASAASGVAR